MVKVTSEGCLWANEGSEHNHHQQRSQPSNLDDSGTVEGEALSNAGNLQIKDPSGVQSYPESGDSEKDSLKDCRSQGFSDESQTHPNKHPTIRRKIRKHRYAICTALCIIQQCFLLVYFINQYYSSKNPLIQTKTDTSPNISLHYDQSLHMSNKSPSEYSSVKCVPDKNNQNLGGSFNFTRFMPGWTTTTKDFCHGSNYELLITDNQSLVSLLSSEIACPEQISALEISTFIKSADLSVLLHSFCRVRKLTFTGIEVCEMDNDNAVEAVTQHEIVDPASLEVIKFERLAECNVIYEMLINTVWAKKLRSLEFKCVHFTNKDFNLLSNFVALSSEFHTISCSDQNLCNNLMFDVSRDVNILTGRIDC